MSKSYKFKGDVNHSFSKKKKKITSKERVDPKNEKTKKKDTEDYLDWEDDGDFEKFTRKKW